MSRKRRSFDPEFKLEALRLAQQDGMRATAAARQLGISASLIYRWRRVLAASGCVGSLPSVAGSRKRAQASDSSPQNVTHNQVIKGLMRGGSCSGLSITRCPGASRELSPANSPLQMA